MPDAAPAAAPAPPASPAASACAGALAAEGFGGARAGFILGSGWGHFIDTAEVLRAKSFAEIPGFGESTVPGHAGRLVRGRLRGAGGRTHDFLAMQGRLHRYEGHPMARIAGAVATLAGLGVRRLVVTNAAGAVNPALRVGDLVRIDDFVHFMFESPLAGTGIEGFGGAPGSGDSAAAEAADAPRRSSALSPRLAVLADAAAARAGIPLGRGVLFASQGPTYETPAEVRMARAFGADLVSRSTTPELITAGALGLESVAFSCVTNSAPGVVPGRAVNHDEVIEVMSAAKERCAALLAAVLQSIEE